MEELSVYCPLIEKKVQLKGKLVGKGLFLPEGCSEAGCPMKYSVNCLLFRVVEAKPR